MINAIHFFYLDIRMILWIPFLSSNRLSFFMMRKEIDQLSAKNDHL